MHVGVLYDSKVGNQWVTVPDPGGGGGGHRGQLPPPPPPKMPPNLTFTLIFLTNSVDLLQG